MKGTAKNTLLAMLIVVILVIVVSFFLLKGGKSDKGNLINITQVDFLTKDNVNLKADLFEPTFKKDKNMPGVVLLSPFNESRKIYNLLASDLCGKGIVVLSVDVRGTGESEIEVDPVKMTQIQNDAAAALQYLKKNDRIAEDKLAILGTAITARSALLGIQENKIVKAAVLVSAFLDSVGIDIIKNSPDLPILVVASYQDGLAANQVKKLLEESSNKNSDLKVYFNAGEGSQIFYAPASYEMVREITDWLWEQLSR